MFPNASGSGGVDRHHPPRGAVHPYLDSVPPGPGSRPFPSFPFRNGSDSAGAEYDGRASGGDDLPLPVDPADGGGFREEDRMLLRLLYHQQQALQVQLNTLTEWVQQVSYRIASVERRVQQAAHSTAAGPAPPPPPPSHAGQPVSRSASAAEQPQATEEAARRPPSAAGSVYSGQSRLVSSALGVSSVLEGSQACTPPSEQTRHHAGGVGGSSAVPSTTRSYESALAAPWDPHNASSAAAALSRTSSHTSALGRRANPLLNASLAKSRLQLPGQASRSTLADSRLQPPPSHLDASTLSGMGATGGPGAGGDGGNGGAQPRQPPVVSPPAAAALNYSSAAVSAAFDAAVPPYRRIPVDAMPATRQPLSRAAAMARNAAPPATQLEVAEGRSGREATLPPPPQSAATSSVQDDPPHPTHATAGAEQTREPTAAPPVPADPGNGRVPAVPSAAQGRRSVDDDDLSDGYGSYESRQYMKSLGLL